MQFGIRVRRPSIIPVDSPSLACTPGSFAASPLRAFLRFARLPCRLNLLLVRSIGLGVATRIPGADSLPFSRDLSLNQRHVPEQVVYSFHCVQFVLVRPDCESGAQHLIALYHSLVRLRCAPAPSFALVCLRSRARRALSSEHD